MSWVLVATTKRWLALVRLGEYLTRLAPERHVVAVDKAVGIGSDVVRVSVPSSRSPIVPACFARADGVYTPQTKETKWKYWFDAWSAVEPRLGVLERELVRGKEVK